MLSTVVRFYFLKHDPGLVESRLKVGPTAEHEKSQKMIQTLTAILWCALVIVPGIERHFHSSRIPVALVLLGNALVALGYYIVFLALRENSWAASIIEVRPGQSVISTGPYGIVRHPMYSGGLLMILRPMMFSSSIMLFGPRLPAGVILHGDTRVVLVVSLAVAVAVLKSALPKRIRSDGRM